MPRIRVLLADDHTLVRGGLRALLSYYADVEVIGEARDGKEAVARVAELQPDIVLMDIAMPEMNGLEATRVIRAQYPHTRVLVLTQHEDRRFVLSLLQAGASGYVHKRALETELVAALRTIAQGGSFIDPTVATLVVDAVRHPDKVDAVPVESLTARERQVLGLIAQGKTNSQIAAALTLSVHTVVWHRVNLMSKLGVHKVADLVRYALEHGLAPDK